MSDRSQAGPHPEDLPWNGVPADSDVVYGTEEPDPAEVEGDAGAEVDVSRPLSPDSSAKYGRDTLDERLSEEEPEVGSRAQARIGDIQAPESDEDDITLNVGERDDGAESGSVEEPAAEEAALHIANPPRRTV
jgi:hypothetical protein